MVLEPVDLEDPAIYIVGNGLATFPFMDMRQPEGLYEAISLEIARDSAREVLDAPALAKIAAKAKEYAARQMGRFVWSNPLRSGDASEVLFITTDSHPDTAKRVLVVDDHRDAADGLAMILEAEAFEVAIARNGPAALGAFFTFRPHSVLLDLGLPKLDGFEVAKAIRRAPNGARVKLVAFSGFADPGARQRAFEAGFDDYVAKPAVPRDLIALLR